MVVLIYFTLSVYLNRTPSSRCAEQVEPAIIKQIISVGLLAQEIRHADGVL